MFRELDMMRVLGLVTGVLFVAVSVASLVGAMPREWGLIFTTLPMGLLFVAYGIGGNALVRRLKGSRYG